MITTALAVAAAVSALLAIAADWEERRHRAFFVLKPLTTALIIGVAASLSVEGDAVPDPYAPIGSTSARCPTRSRPGSSGTTRAVRISGRCAPPRGTSSERTTSRRSADTRAPAVRPRVTCSASA
jgi:hypothetical protein